ncbi:MAG: transposase [Candidatus Binataceae bacterium]
MRGDERGRRVMLVIFDADRRSPSEHPLPRSKRLADMALVEFSPAFDRMCSVVGRPSIPPEGLLEASWLVAPYTVRGEWLLCEQLDHNFLFCGFLDLEADDASFDHSTFSRDRAPLLEH